MATPPVFITNQVLTSAAMNLVGWWKITTATFSATSAVNVDNCFTSDYRNYALLLEYTTSGAQNVGIQLRAGGVSAATNYNLQSLNASAATVTAARNTALTGLPFGYSTNGAFSAVALLYVFGPQLADATNFTLIAGESYGAYTVPLIRYDKGNHSTTTAYDGFALSVASGQTTTGRYTVYGIRP
jgi:hypothetical protein